MRLYIVELDFWTRTRRQRVNRRLRRWFVIEAESIHVLHDEAMKVAHANEPCNCVGVEFRCGHSLRFPAELKLAKRSAPRQFLIA